MVFSLNPNSIPYKSIGDKSTFTVFWLISENIVGLPIFSQQNYMVFSNTSIYF